MYSLIMKCTLQHRDRLIAGYVLDELSENEAAQFEEHYFQCDHCFNDVRTARDAVELIRKEGVTVTADDIPSSQKPALSLFEKVFPREKPVIRRPGIAIAAAVIVLVLFFTLTDKIFHTGYIEDHIAELTGPAFEPDPYLEEWIVETLRSEHTLIDTVISPQIGEVFYMESVRFQWDMAERKPVSLKIMTNTEEIIYTRTTDRNGLLRQEITVDAETFPEPGLYYWRIEDEYEVLFIGKFYFLIRSYQNKTRP